MSKLSFEQFITNVGLAQAEKMNTCHDNLGQFCSTGGGGTGSSTLDSSQEAYISELVTDARSNYGGTIPSDDKIKPVAIKLAQSKKLSTNAVLDIASEFNVSDGLASHIANKIKKDRQVEKIPSFEEARANRVLRITDSSGRARARKF